MSFLKKKGRQVWVPEVRGKKYVPGYWYTYTEYVPKYVSGGSGGSASGPKVEDRGVINVPGFGWGDPSGLIVDY